MDRAAASESNARPSRTASSSAMGTVMMEAMVPMPQSLAASLIRNAHSYACLASSGAPVRRRKSPASRSSVGAEGSDAVTVLPLGISLARTGRSSP